MTWEEYLGKKVIKDIVTEINDIPSPEAGAPMPFVQADEGRLCLSYYIPDSKNIDKATVVYIEHYDTFLFGGPNDETLDGHPLYENGLKLYSIHEVNYSSWIEKIEQQNSVHEQHRPDNYFNSLKHLIITFHDSTFECLYWGKLGFDLVESMEEGIKLMKEYMKDR